MDEPTVGIDPQSRRHILDGVKDLRAEGATVLEGNPPFPRTIILKFVSQAAAKAWYQSPEYQKILPLRLQGTQGYAVLVDGFDVTAS